MFAPADLTSDAFLGGKIQILQPKSGYRAGVDPVLLAAATPARPNQSVLELGCGAGVATLCLATRVPNLRLSGVEVQPAYADLARQNAAANGETVEITTADLRRLPDSLRQQQFDHIIANPPYFDRRAGTSAQDEGRDVALGGDTPLADWIDIAARRLGPKGQLTLIQRIERLPELLAAAQSRLGSLSVVPLAARIGRPAHLMLFHAKKSGRADFRLLAPVALHDGASHDRNRDSYAPEISAVLRDGAHLPLFD